MIRQTDLVMQRLIWKEFRQQVPLFFALLVLSIVVLASCEFMWKVGGENRVLELTIGLASIYLIAGLVTAFTSEHESKSLKFFDAIPVHFSSIASSKLLTVIAGAFLFQIVLIIIAFASVWLSDELTPLPDYKYVWFDLFMLPPIEFCLWGLFFSLVCNRTLIAMILGLVVPYLFLGLLIGVFSPGKPSFDLVALSDVLWIRMAVAAVLLVTDSIFLVSWWRTNAYTLKRPHSSRKLVNGEIEQSIVQDSIRGTSIGRLIWINLVTQIRPIIAIPLIAFLAIYFAGFWAQSEYTYYLFVFSFAWMGYHAFCLDCQTGQSSQWITLGIPPSRVIVSKLVCWVPVGLLLVLMIAISFAFSFELLRWDQPPPPLVDLSFVDQSSSLLVFQVGAHQLACVAAALFSISALASAYFRSIPIGFLVAVVLGTAVYHAIKYFFMLNVPTTLTVWPFCFALFLVLRLRMNRLSNSRGKFYDLVFPLLGLLAAVLTIACFVIIYRMLIEPAYESSVLEISQSLIVIVFSTVLAVIFLIAHSTQMNALARRMGTPKLLLPKYTVSLAAILFAAYLSFALGAFTPTIPGHYAHRSGFNSLIDFQHYEAAQNKKIELLEQINTAINRNEPKLPGQETFKNQCAQLVDMRELALIPGTHIQELEQLAKFLAEHADLGLESKQLKESLSLALLRRKLLQHCTIQGESHDFQDLRKWAHDPDQTPEMIRQGINDIKEHFENRLSLSEWAPMVCFNEWQEPGSSKGRIKSANYAFARSVWEKPVYFRAVDDLRNRIKRFNSMAENQKVMLWRPNPLLSDQLVQQRRSPRFELIFGNNLNESVFSLYREDVLLLQQVQGLLTELALIEHVLTFGKYPERLEELSKAIRKKTIVANNLAGQIYYENSGVQKDLVHNDRFFQSVQGPYLIAYPRSLFSFHAVDKKRVFEDLVVHHQIDNAWEIKIRRSRISDLSGLFVLTKQHIHQLPKPELFNVNAKNSD